MHAVPRLFTLDPHLICQKSASQERAVQLHKAELWCAGMAHACGGVRGSRCRCLRCEAGAAWGVGEFLDIKLLVDICHASGQPTSGLERACRTFQTQPRFCALQHGLFWRVSDELPRSCLAAGHMHTMTNESMPPVCRVLHDVQHLWPVCQGVL